MTLEPFHDRVAQRVRQIDDEHLFFFESITWDDFIPVGYNHAPANDGIRSVLSYHYYDPPNLNIENHFKTRAFDTERLGCGGFLTEFDAPGGSAVEIMDNADAHLQSWQGWEYKHFIAITGYDDPFFNKDGSLKLDNVLIHSRTYAHAVAGRTKLMNFNHTSSAFKLEYDVLEENIGVPTIIYYNKELRYSKGVEFIVSDYANLTFVGDNYIHIEYSKKGTVSFMMSPRK